MVYVMLQEHRYMPRRLPWLMSFVLVAGILVGIGAAFGLMDSLFENLEKSISIRRLTRVALSSRGPMDGTP